MPFVSVVLTKPNGTAFPFPAQQIVNESELWRATVFNGAGGGEGHALLTAHLMDMMGVALCRPYGPVRITFPTPPEMPSAVKEGKR
jgi:hypothetical protein